MNRNTLIKFNKIHALAKGLEIVIHLPKDTNVEKQTIEEIRVPRMLDITGKKYYLTNVNKYLGTIGNSNGLVAVFVITNGNVHALLVDWLAFNSINWEDTEDYKDEDTS